MPPFFVLATSLHPDDPNAASSEATSTSADTPAAPAAAPSSATEAPADAPTAALPPDPSPPDTTTPDDLEPGVGTSVADALTTPRRPEALYAAPSPASGPTVETDAPSPPEASAAPRSPILLRVGLGVLVIALGSLVGYFLWRPEAPQVRNAMVLAVERAPSVRFASISNPDDERIQEALEVAPPRLEGYTLTGFASDRVLRTLRVPVLRYERADGAPVYVYAFTYALLDASEGRLRLARNLLYRLATDGHLEAQDMGDVTALLWRDRATLFIGVTEEAPENVAERLERP